MRDVILAAAGEAADTTSMPARESGHAEPRDDMTAQLTQARTAGEAEGVKQGSTSERARIKAIITSDQAKGREDLAYYFAFDTNLAAETVLLALSKSPASKTTLDSAMARETSRWVRPTCSRRSLRRPTISRRSIRSAPRYAKAIPSDNNKSVRLEMQTNPLSLCLRPRALIKGLHH